MAVADLVFLLVVAVMVVGVLEVHVIGTTVNDEAYCYTLHLELSPQATYADVGESPV